MISERFYHIYNHANGSDNLFRSQENYRYFLQRYYHFIPDVADTYAYCLMPNHIHFLVKVKEEASISEFIERQTSKVSKNLTEPYSETSKVFRNLGGLDRSLIEKRVSQQFSNLFNSYTKSFNKMYSRKGSLFMQNFKRREITNDSYFTKVIHYIHTNPIHHGFVSSITDWPWSSFQLLLLDLPSQLKKKEVLDWFGNSDEYVKFHSEPINRNILLEMEF